MIRMARIFLFGKKFWEVPLFNQRMTSLPKQIFVEFSVVANQEESAFKEQRKSSSVENEEKTRDRFSESYQEIKYTSLRQIFNGTAMKTSGHLMVESVLKDFYNNMSNFSPPEIIKVLQLLSSTNNRPKASIKALCDLLCSNEQLQLSISDCIALLTTLSKLSYKDERVIGMVATDLKKLDNFQSPKYATLILHSFGDLKFKDVELLDKLFKYVLSKTQTINTSLSCLRTACLLNYQSDEVVQLIKILSKSDPTDFRHSGDFINFIWSCVILNRLGDLTKEQISVVLSPNFVTKMLNNGAHNCTKWKLLNINGGAKLLKNYDGPFLDNHPHYKIMNLSLPKPLNSFMESVLDTLSYVVPQSAQLKPFINTGAGFYLDFEFYDLLGNELLINDQKKVGLVLLTYSDICSDNSISGLAAFKINTLKSLGYKVIDLRYSEYKTADPLTKKIDCLRKKMENADPSKAST